MPIPTIKWLNGKVKLINQTLLPQRLGYRICKNEIDMWHSIKKLEIRGAPLIGIATGFGVLLGIWRSKAENFNDFKREFQKAASYLKTSRPTAVNLFWAIERMKKVIEKNKRKSISGIKKSLLKEVLYMIKEDQKTNRKMATYGASLIKNKDRVLTYCNAGFLATYDYGTAVGVFYRAKELGKHIKVYSCETRPLLQGSRLTCWELFHDGIDVTLICDNMAATLMRQRKIDKIFVGADRIASNGDTANKIGTYNIAVLAKYHKIPFYVVAPVSTFDFKIKSGSQIPIEERAKDEIICGFGKLTAPKDIKVYNPAFDVTPNELITAVVTEKGILYPSFNKAICKLKVKK